MNLTVSKMVKMNGVEIVVAVSIATAPGEMAPASVVGWVKDILEDYKADEHEVEQRPKE